MSGLLKKRAWLGGAALVAAFTVVACGDDDGGGDDTTAGKAGGGAGGKAGAPAGGSAGSSATAGNSTAGSSSAGSAGKGGTSTTEGGMAGSDAGSGGQAGEPPGPGGAGGDGGDGGGGGEGGEDLKDVVRATFAGMSPLPAVPADPTNAFADSAAAAALGQRLFFDEKFSGALTADSDLGTTGDTQKVSCKSCHDGAALDDTRSNPDTVSKGTGLHTRNSPPLANSSYYTWTNWGGRFSAQWELPLAVAENGAIMNGNRLAIAHRIFDVYKNDYEAVFGTMTAAIGTDAARFPATGKPTVAAFDGMAADDKVIINRILVNYSKAIAAYMRKLVSPEAAFDKFMDGDDAALTLEQQRGALVFSKSGCKECHSGPTFSDQTFHDLGVPQTGLNNIPAADDGRFKDTPGLLASAFNRDGIYSDKTDTGKLQTIPAVLPDDWKGRFRTPSLREVALTAPYMHSGQFATLSDVIDFYKAGGNADTAVGQLVAFTITDQEKADLIAFLGALNGKAVPAALLLDTAAP